MNFYKLKIYLPFLFIFFVIPAKAQVQDSIIQTTDSIRHIDSAVPKARINIVDSLLRHNKYLNYSATPISFIAKERVATNKEFLFYLLAIVIFLLGLFKVFYSRYFNNIFRVFFNTSLRQNQLTDLLLQARLPSMIFNIFFMISAGLYVWLLLNQLQITKFTNTYMFIGFSILFVAAIYSGKYFALKFIGWISGMSQVTDQYIFVIFLINKILGIILIPFIILLAFAPANWLQIITVASFFVFGIFFLLRYLRSYGLLQNQLKVNGFHFLLYIIGMEILPLILLYKLIIKLLL